MKSKKRLTRVDVTRIFDVPTKMLPVMTKGVKRLHPITLSGLWDDAQGREAYLLAAMKRKKRIVIMWPLSDMHDARMVATVTSVRRVKREKGRR